MTNLCGLWSNLVYYTLMKTTTTKPVKSTCIFQVKENLKVEVRTKLFWDDPHWVAMAKMSWVFHRFLWGQEVLTFTVVHSTHIDLERQSFKTECFTKKKIKKINKGSFWQHILLLFFFFFLDPYVLLTVLKLSPCSEESMLWCRMYDTKCPYLLIDTSVCSIFITGNCFPKTKTLFFNILQWWNLSVLAAFLNKTQTSFSFPHKLLCMLSVLVVY